MSDRPSAPYVGLAPFQEGDAALFFGRDAERRRIVGNLRASRFTLLYARSGVGKSSLLRAGVVARMAELPRRSHGTVLLPVIYSTWRDDPVAGLVAAIEAAVRARGGAPTLAGATLQTAIREASAAAGATLLLILDQFEEFFQYHAGTPAAERFGDALSACVLAPDVDAHVLVSIREDAYSQLGDHFKSRLPNVYANYLRLDYLDEAAARSAIASPLERLGDGRGNGNGRWPSSVEEPLVEAVLEEVRRDADRYDTAYLQFLMRRLWDEEAAAGSDAMRLATLQRLGGAQTLIRRHVDDVMEALPAGRRDAAAEAFRFLVTSAGTKKAQSAAELSEFAEVPPEDLQPALDHLQAERVLIPVASPEGVRYELAHDLLAEAVLDWRKRHQADRETRELQERIAAGQRRAQRARRAAAGLAVLVAVMAAAVVWAVLERAEAARQRDTAESQALVAEALTALPTDPERGVLLARRAWRSRPTAAADATLRRALAESRVRRRIRLGTVSQARIAGGRVPAVLTAGPGGTAVWRTSEPRRPAVRAPAVAGESRKAFSDDGTAFAVSSPAGTLVHRAGAAPVRLGGGAEALASLVLDGTGRFLAAQDAEGAPGVWDARTGRRVARLPPAPAGLMPAFDPDDPGRVVLAGCLDGKLRLWAWRRGTARDLGGAAGAGGELPRGYAWTCALAVSPDGARAVAGRLTGSAALWDLRRGRRVRRDVVAAQDAVADVAFTPDGSRVAIAAGKVATLLDARTGRVVQRLPQQADFVTAVAFSADGHLLVTGGRDQSARVWDLPSGTVLAELRGHRDEVLDAAFEADGRSVWTVALDGTARRWEVGGGDVLRGGDWMLDVAAGPRGDLLATASADGTARLWRPATGRTAAIRGDFDLRRVNAVGFDGTGRHVVAAGAGPPGYGIVVVAEVTGDGRMGALRAELPLPGEEIRSAALSPDGRRVVTMAAQDPPVVRSVDGAAAPAKLPVPASVFTLQAEFSPDGRRIVTAGSDGVVRVFDAGSLRQVAQLRRPGLVNGAAFSPDGARVLSYGSDGTAQILEARSGRLLHVLRGHASWVSGGAWSPDGRRVATSSPDLTTRVWDARTGRLLSQQRMHGDAVNSVAFLADGRLASAGDDHAVRVYPCATCEDTDELVRLAGRRLAG